jgi:hypothetical protein
VFKVLLIQATNNLSDERTELLINDRPSSVRFLKLGLQIAWNFTVQRDRVETSEQGRDRVPLGSTRIGQRYVQLGPEALEIHGLGESQQLIAEIAQTLQAITDIEKSASSAHRRWARSHPDGE